jgi:hypothetical protein
MLEFPRDLLGNSKGWPSPRLYDKSPLAVPPAVGEETLIVRMAEIRGDSAAGEKGRKLTHLGRLKKLNEPSSA